MLFKTLKSAFTGHASNILTAYIQGLLILKMRHKVSFPFRAHVVALQQLTRGVASGLN
ncbi:MAG TPA: hypothetical protein VE912_09440 [Bacteroidales bacterium]|nr:hypothetical protein [Bacteroidales bacterium]